MEPDQPDKDREPAGVWEELEWEAEGGEVEWGEPGRAPVRVESASAPLAELKAPIKEELPAIKASALNVVRPW